MRRRNFIKGIVGSAAAWPFAVLAQQPAMPVIGYLHGRSLASDAHLVAAFRQGLSENGYVEGRNVSIEFRWADGRLDRLATLADDLVKRRVSAVFAGGIDVQIRVLHSALSTIPTVFASAGDPVELGIVASYNRPGGNATVVTVISAALWPKRMELLREMVGQPTSVAFLVNSKNATADSSTKELQSAARRLGVSLLVLNASTESEFDSAFSKLDRDRPAGLLVAQDALFINRRERIIALAAQFRVPTMYDRREFVTAGGLVSYGASIIDQYRQSGLYIGKILAGTKPAQLPVLQPTKFELMINLKTAKALSLVVPPTLLARADEVIE